MARANFVVNVWMRATLPHGLVKKWTQKILDSPRPTAYMNIEPIWYSGLMMPTNILVGESDDEEEEEATGNESDVAAEGADYEETSDE